MKTVNIEQLTFELRRSERKTLGVTVDRDGALILTAPKDAAADDIERAARRKLPWVHRKLAERRLLHTEPQEKQFVSGEGFFYLGRSYRLLLREEEGSQPLSLTRGRFMLRRDALPDASNLFVRWYAAHAEPWIRNRTQLFDERISGEWSSLKVRDLGYRWGSCTPGGNLNFNWRLICLPPAAIEYVIVHELVHLEERGHGKAFWTRLARIMPDYGKRKAWLARNSAYYIPALPTP